MTFKNKFAKNIYYNIKIEIKFLSRRLYPNIVNPSGESTEEMRLVHKVPSRACGHTCLRASGGRVGSSGSDYHAAVHERPIPTTEKGNLNVVGNAHS